jgi:Integrase core domain/HTH-like domain
MAGEGLPVEVACRALGVSCAGFYAWRFRPPSARAVRHAWLTDVIREVHAASYGTYGAKRVHAELVLGRGIRVGHNAITMLMSRAGIAGRTGSPKRRGMPGAPTAAELVDRIFVREGPNQLWVTDVTEHPTREGKVYCAVVLDAFSRRVVGWSISHNPTAALTSNALGMAVEQREAVRGETVIHSDHGTQGGFKWSSQHLVMEVVRDGCSRASEGGSGDAWADVVAGPALDRAPGGSAAVLAGDSGWMVERGGGRDGGGVAGGWRPVVPRRWRDAANLTGSAVGALSLIC